MRGQQHIKKKRKREERQG